MLFKINQIRPFCVLTNILEIFWNSLPFLYLSHSWEDPFQISIWIYFTALNSHTNTLLTFIVDISSEWINEVQLYYGGPILWILLVENICEMCIIMLQCCGKTILCFTNRKSFLGEHQSIPFNAWQYFSSSSTTSGRVFYPLCQIFIFLSNVDFTKPAVKKSKMKKNCIAGMTLIVVMGKNIALWSYLAVSWGFINWNQMKDCQKLKY